jgi:hypothetical protein
LINSSDDVRRSLDFLDQVLHEYDSDSTTKTEPTSLPTIFTTAAEQQQNEQHQATPRKNVEKHGEDAATSIKRVGEMSGEGKRLKTSSSDAGTRGGRKTKPKAPKPPVPPGKNSEYSSFNLLMENKLQYLHFG